MDNKLRSLIFQAIDQTISEEDFERLQDAIEHDEEVRQEYLRTISLCESLGEIASELISPDASADDVSSHSESSLPSTLLASKPGSGGSRDWRMLSVAAALLILVGGAAFWLGRQNRLLNSEQLAADSESGGEIEGEAESRIAGHATLRRAVDVKWSANSMRRLEGDVLPNGVLAFEEGIAEIDFFCGATLIVEGPAHLDIESDWSVRIAEGRLRANVPPPARGFVVKAAGSEIVDLGTEFAMEVGAENARVEVIDGEVELRGGDYDGKHLVTGESQSLKGTQDQVSLTDTLTTMSDVQRRQRAAEEQRFARWKDYSQQVASDKRLIAYYPIAASQSGRSVQDASHHGSGFDGLLVGPVERTMGRFGSDSRGLEFDRPGARVRTRIEGEFEAFTFACWVKIDSLAHRYNALFMGDGYETGEPHWQIRDDGSLMFSVMVDDTQKIRHFSTLENRMVTQAGLHRVYYTKPFWDISKSGQWFHIVSVYDPAVRRVFQYVNGELLASEAIADEYHIARLRIGAAEIGNWGQPFRKTPSFAVRNLDGTIDELAIYNAALNAHEINQLYQQGKPLGY